MDEPVLAWYFASADRRTLHGASRLRPGGTEFYSGELVLGHRGLHASRDPIDALILGHGPIACRVELAGARIEGDTQLCATQRTVMWLADASELLRSRARDALREHVDADLEDEAGLRRMLETAREEVEDRFDRLRDGEWKKRERGEDIDLAELRANVEAVRVRARLLDAAVRLYDERFEALRSVYEDLRELGVQASLDPDELPRLTDEPTAPSPHPLDPMPVRKGPLYDARDPLGRELGKIGGITRAGYGVHHDTDVLFIGTTRRRRPNPQRDASLIIEHVRGLVAARHLIVLLDRAHAFRVDLKHDPLLTDTTEREAIDLRATEVLGEISLLRVQLTAHRVENESRWKPRLKDGPAVSPNRAFIEAPVFEQAADKTPVTIGTPVRSIPPNQGVSVWWGATFDEAKGEVRSRFGPYGDATPCVIVASRPFEAVSFEDDLEPALLVQLLSTTATRVVTRDGVAHWSTRCGRSRLGLHETSVLEIGNTAGFRIFALPQQPPLVDDAWTELLRSVPWILAAWSFYVREQTGCLGLEVWRTDPRRELLADARDLAEAWRSVAGSTRLAVVFAEASPVRWVISDEHGTVETAPLPVVYRALCYLATPSV